jgi:hypothetical protein
MRGPTPVPPALRRPGLRALIVGAALVLLLGVGPAAGRASGRPSPAAAPDEACSAATLRGAYGGLGTGVNVSSPLLPEGPLALVNVVVFDGRGRLSVPMETMSFGGDVRRLTAPVAATYAVAPDCTGSLYFDEANVFDFVIVGGGAEVLAVHATPGLVHTVVLKRQTARSDQG